MADRRATSNERPPEGVVNLQLHELEGFPGSSIHGVADQQLRVEHDTISHRQ